MFIPLTLTTIPCVSYFAIILLSVVASNVSWPTITGPSRQSEHDIRYNMLWALVEWLEMTVFSISTWILSKFLKCQGS